MSTSKVDPSTGLSLKEQQIIQKHSSLELLSQVYQTARTAYIEAETQYNVEYGKWEKSRSSGISKFDQSVVSPHNPSQSKAATEAEEMRDGETAEALLEASAREWQRKVEYAAFDLLGARKRLEEGLEQYAPTQSLSSDRTDGTGKTGGSVSKDLLSARAWISRAKERFHKPSGHRGYNKLQ